MTDSTTTPTHKQLFSLTAGDTFEHRGTAYVMTGFGRSRAQISRLSDGKAFVLAGTARVMPTGRDEDALARALQAGPRATLDLRPGQKVRIVTNQRTRNAGIAGVETIITKVNAKTYALATGYRVSPDYVEAI